MQYTTERYDDIDTDPERIYFKGLKTRRGDFGGQQCADDAGIPA